MSGIDSVSRLRDQVEELASKGYTTVNIDQLALSLNNIINRGDQAREFDLTNHSHALEYERSTNIEMFKSVIVTGQSALKSAMLLNGGAAVAMLAFVGKLVEHNSMSASEVAEAVLLFAIGALLATLATGSTYLSQMCYGLDGAEGTWKARIAASLHVITVTFVAASLGLFGYGAWRLSEAVAGIKFVGQMYVCAPFVG